MLGFEPGTKHSNFRTNTEPIVFLDKRMYHLRHMLKTTRARHKPHSSGYGCDLGLIQFAGTASDSSSNGSKFESRQERQVKIHLHS